MTVQYAYNGQIRKFVLQFIRILSNFQVEFGDNSLQTVPVYYGDVNRQAAMILHNNSENALNTVPAMATYISALTYDRERLQNPYHESSIRVRQQAYDQSTQSYTGTQDNLYTIERLMPAPYKLTMKVDIWTSNTEQKHQLIEQIAPLFNPGIEIQSTDNYVDWGSLSVVLLTDTSYTNRTIPMGSDDVTIDITTLTFEMPIWLSLPAKVKKMGVVAEIIASIYDAQGELSADATTTLAGLMSQQKFTPLNYEVLFLGNVLTLYKPGAHGDTLITGEKAEWRGLVNIYGTLANGISQVRLVYEHETGRHEIVGTVAYDPSDTANLLFTPISSTLPTNTLAPVNAIIDPYHIPLNDTALPITNPPVGTRYLILNPIGDANSEPAAAWAGTNGTNLIARKNDIIEWNGNYWTVAFDSRNLNVQYVTNINTTVQYRWTGENWVKSYEGLYTSGNWKLVL